MPFVRSPRRDASGPQPRVGRRFALRLGAALVALASILIVAAVWSLGESAKSSRRSQVADQLTVGLSSALHAVETRLRELDTQADRFVRDPSFQEALDTRDTSRLARLASSDRGITFFLGERRFGEAPAGLRRVLVLRQGGRAIGRVVASTPVNGDLYSRLGAAGRLADGHRLLLVAEGRVLLGGDPGTRLRAEGPGETNIGGSAYLTRSAAVPGSKLRIVTAAPSATVTAGVRDFQRRLLIAAFGSLALLILLAAVFGGPILRALGDLTRVTRAAELDALTGVANRGSFDTRLAVESRRAVDLGTRLSLILFDVDHFKSINDTYGHQTGDEVLRRIGALLQDRLRGSDFGARYGGEEFAVLLPDTNDEGAMILAERLRAAVSELRVPAGDEELTPTASFGVASFPEHDPARLVAAADAALYDAKRAGRDRSVAAIA
jgi:diguanylate cyclase (GGDEF)-like protein